MNRKIKIKGLKRILFLYVIGAMLFSKMQCFANDMELVSMENEEIAEKRIEVKDVEISNYERELNVDATMNLTVTVLPSDATDTTVTYKSSNSKIATVNSSGEVKGIASGEVVIYVTAGNITKEAAIRVKVATTAIQLNSSYQVMKPNETFQIKTSVQPAGAEDKVTYKSTNEKVATVSAKGVITAKSCGSAAVIITNGEAHVSVSVIVNENGVVSDKMEESGESREENIVFPEKVNVQKYAVISEGMLKYFYETEKMLTIQGDGYTMYLDGRDIVNYENELKTELRFQTEENGFSFVANGGNKLCGKIKIDLSKKVTDEKYLYLYNEQKDRYQRIAMEDIKELSIDTAGTYLLTSELLSEWRMNVILIVAAIVAILIGVGVYIGVKKQYWFW